MSHRSGSQSNDEPVSGRTFPHETRTATQQAAFLLPFLSANMRLLDVGCGPGSITVDLAETVVPGAVVGMDNDPQRIESAKAHAAERAVRNVSFEVGDAAALSFLDGTFDAAFANTLLQHVPDPGAVIAEVFRVLKPGGVFGVRDVAGGNSMICTNVTPDLTEAGELVHRWHAASGTDRNIGSRLYSLLEQAGFAQLQISASYDNYSTPEAVKRFAGVVARILQSDALAEKAEAMGWADRDTITRLAAAWAEWGERPGSFVAAAHYEVVGWKPETSQG